MLSPPLERKAKRAAEIAGTTRAGLFARCRTQRLVDSRQALMLVLREHGLSYPRIARALARKDHTTAIHGVGMAQERAATNPAFAWIVQELRES